MTPGGGDASDEPVAVATEVEPVEFGDRMYARTYDSLGIVWDEELDTYLRFSRDAAAGPVPVVLELACGTGRVALPLADAGCKVMAVDHSKAMLGLARRKRDDGNPQWLEGDLRSVTAPAPADLAIIAAHSFQFMLTPQDQLAALENVARNLRPGGRLALHVELAGQDWLRPRAAPADGEGPTRAEPAYVDAVTGVAWEPQWDVRVDAVAETVTVRCDWLRLDESGEVLERRRQVPLSLKRVGVAELHHVLARAGFSVLERLEWSRGTAGAPGATQLVWLAQLG